MVSNPMQRKSRNSFLLGVILTLVISAIIIGLLLVALKNKTEQLNAELNAKRSVYVLNQNVKSGQVLTEDMFVVKKVNQDAIPNNATSVAEVVDAWFLQTKEGEMICTDNHGGLYLDRSDETKATDEIIEVLQNENKAFVDSKGQTVAKGDLFIYVDGGVEKFNSNTKTIQDDNGAFIIDSNQKDVRIKIYQEDSTGEFYIYKLDKTTINTGDSATRVKEYIDIKNVPVIAKVTMNANTVITPNLVVQSDEVVTDDVRQQEYNMVVLPVDLMTDDYIDIRLMTPSGQDFIVVSKAKVDVPMNEDDTYVTDTIRINLREDEILSMSSAIVEAYGLVGSKLYATKYVEAGMQEPSAPTYTPNAAVTAQIQSNPNIVEIAKEELASRYSDSSKKARNDYLQSLINESEDYKGNITTHTEEDMTKANEARKKYLESLNY